MGFGFLVALLAVTSGFALAIFLRSLPPHWQAPGLGLILIPKTAGMLATLFGLQRWLPRGLLASLIAETYLILPYAVLILFVQLLAINPELVAAARGLGASSWQIFRRITIPLSRPGLLTAFEMTLIWGLGAFLGPLFLGGPGQTTLSIELHRQAFEYGRWPRAAAEAVGLLALLALTLLAGNVASRIDRPDRQS